MNELLYLNADYIDVHCENSLSCVFMTLTLFSVFFMGIHKDSKTMLPPFQNLRTDKFLMY